MVEPLLEVSGLKKYFKTNSGILHAVDDVSFTIEKGKTLGIVGESGCGKSTTGRCILRLIEPSDGKIVFNGIEIGKLDNRHMRAMRCEMQMIFQDPFSSLNPRKTVAQAIAEPLVEHHICKSRKELYSKVQDLMQTVGIAERLYNAYPHELDGGRRQRIGIARALALNPKFIVCDEPVSALDVSIQAQILNLLQDLQDQFGHTYIFITHDLSVVKHLSDNIAVMYLGQILERAPTDELFSNPLHPYTKALLSAIPIPEIGGKREHILLKGEISQPIDPPDECRFFERCSESCKQCLGNCPKLREVLPGHFVACHLA